MIAYAEAQFALSRRQEDGRSYRELLAHAAALSQAARAELDALESVPLPDAAAHVWETFMEISAHRTSSGFGPSTLSWLDLDAWQRVTRVELTPLERGWLFELDRMFIEDQAKEQRKRAQKR